MRSLQTRLFLAIVLVAATALIAVGAFSTRTTALQFEMLQRSRPQPPRIPAGTAARVGAWHARHHSWAGVDAVLRGAGKNLLLFTVDGHFVAASFPGIERATLAPGGDDTVRLSVRAPGKLGGEETLIVSSSPSVAVADARGRVIARVYAVPLPAPPQSNPASVLGRELWLAIVCALIAALIAAMVLARYILAPVQGLRDAAAAMHAGDLSRRARAGGPAEIEDLAHQFNALAAHLQRSEKLRNRMIADIAHELRTPLTNIRAMLEAIEDGHMTANRATLGSLAEEALFLSRLVNDLQDMSLADAGQLKFEAANVSVSQSVRAVVASLEATARAKHIRVGIETAGNDLARADESRLRQIVANIVSNAIRLAPERSVIQITIGQSDGFVNVRVRDEGPGLSPEALDSAFERFYRADESRSRASGGAGLGLAIAKQLVEAQGGRISAANNAGAGATFSFMLPAA